jgi:20S proteasome alpha/beta subunit
MTTIAFDGNTVAYDSRLTRGGLICCDTTNKMLETNGFKIVSAGTEADCDTLIKCFLEGDTPDEDGDASFIANHTDGRLIHVLYHDDKMVIENIWDEGVFALGSGSSYAISAMDFGKSAVEAVKYAATRDCYTGGKIRSFKVRKPKNE